ncbi:hypothetical protein [Streptomyces sp. cmx-4-9]|uniref:hypothetical protein n=1 Tax=Streptomyces sp. cmx-4-9 TaxID=2790941 RepID=UPI00397FB1C6
MDVEEVIDRLYGLAPAGFTAARDEAAARAKQAGDRAAAKRIAGMRRPTLAAWASNLLVRAKPEEAEQFCRLGQALREAHRSLDGEQLRELSHEQHVVVGALAGEAVRLAAQAGTPVSEAALREVEQILRTVLADPDAAAAWASGRLAKPPAVVTEFPALDPGATPPAAGPAPAAPQPDPRAAEALAAATAEARETERTATAREAELRAAEEGHRRAAGEAQRADAARDRAHAAEAEAAQALRTAARAAEEARRTAQAAAGRLQDLSTATPDGTPAP